MRCFSGPSLWVAVLPLRAVERDLERGFGMTDKPSEKILQELRRTCDDLARTRNLSPEQVEELYGHMEDKAFAYLSGDEGLSEEDVVILVREHFGSPQNLEAILGRPATAGYHGFWHAMSHASYSGACTDFWGVLHFPWYGQNIVLHPLCWLVLGELVFLVLLLMRTVLGMPIPVSVLIIVGAAGILVGAVTFLIYRVVATKLTRKRVRLCRHADLDTEGILVRGMTESPAIVQCYNGQLVVTPLLGEQLLIALAQIREARQRRSYNGTVYFGDNAAINLVVAGHRERIGIILPRPRRWSELLGAGRNASSHSSRPAVRST
jgi:hypothetical protein